MLRSTKLPALLPLLAWLVTHSTPIQAWSLCMFGNSPGELATCSGLCQLTCHDPKMGKVK
ncbi:BZ3500_MvSof-1268-A1-R1_Chr1-1g00825 [Microbotryum saponariae]|uniref:BZ3500_MvSof-1268-A1-R1_Chr1-1g00825 protein n=1 Tax=Microbotryum saponariae TaxID=289078 RepID=A0A2X0KJ44_9BASI|nr:BZ3500_MvSof-1268-A1-R1_Chr1-1g00825 [Microbotryum saponariae]SCZ92747.1 BZ3501_MvSof-1269-A2-R1_Chr1-1g00422 [Microbotryum saponariae]